MSLQLIIVVLYIVALFAISAYAKKLTQKGNAESFILAGRQLTAPLVAVTVTGLAIGGASTIGVAENAYKHGLAAGWYNVAWGIGAICVGLISAKKYRSLNVATMPELFERYYGSTARVLTVLSQIVVMVAIASLQYLAGGAILASLLPGIFTMKTGMIMSAVVFVGITFIGGMWSAGLSNVLNVTLIYFGIIMATIVSVNSLGGLEAITSSLPTEVPYMHIVDGLGWATIIAWIVVMATQSQSLQAVVQISFSAKDGNHAKRGFIIGGLLMLPIGFLSAIMGIAAKVAYPDINATMALPQMIMSLNPALAGVTLAALWAADVSTACNLLLGTSTLFSQDIYKKYINPQVDDNKFATITKMTVIVIGIFTFFLALTVVGILKTLTIALSLMTAFTLLFFFTIYKPSMCRKSSASNTIIAGIIVLLLWNTVPASHIVSHPIYLEWIVCPIVFLLTALIDKRNIVVIETVNGGDTKDAKL
jgi:SSS family solute:Na+ symporter